MMSFFNFRTMSVSQAQHKTDIIGEINSLNSLCPAGMFTRQKTKSLFLRLNVMARLLRSLGQSM